MFTTAKIGRGKAVHIYYAWAGRTDCAAGGMSDADATEVDLPVTCKRCLKALPAIVERDHAAAIVEDLERAQAAGPVVVLHPGSTSNPSDLYVVTPFAVWSTWGTKVGPIKGERFRSAEAAQARQTALNPCGGTGCGQATYPRPHKPGCPVGLTRLGVTG